jgi:hypothetical protein
MEMDGPTAQQIDLFRAVESHELTSAIKIITCYDRRDEIIGLVTSDGERLPALPPRGAPAVRRSLARRQRARAPPATSAGTSRCARSQLLHDHPVADAHLLTIAFDVEASFRQSTDRWARSAAAGDIHTG